MTTEMTGPRMSVTAGESMRVSKSAILPSTFGVTAPHLSLFHSVLSTINLPEIERGDIEV